MNRQYLDLMLNFAKEAGIVAMDLIDHSEPSMKALQSEESIVTKADQAISKFTHKYLDQVLVQDNHILIDEEDPNRESYFSQETMDQTEYIWSVDPIDGTRSYASLMPTFGVSLGLLKNCRPYMGVVYFPAMNELFYADGQKAYFVQKPFTDHEKKREIVPLDLRVTSQSNFLCHDSFLEKFDWNKDTCRVMILSCAVIDMCWPAIGRGIGAVFQPALWDFCGSWAVIKAAGLDLRALSDGRVLDKINVKDFGGVRDVWQLNEQYIVSSENNFESLKSNMRERK